MNKQLLSSKSDEWETPIELFNELNEKYHFTLDPSCQEHNHKCEKYYTQKENGLIQDWSGEIVFCNPPYGKSIGEWVKKCYSENKNNNVFICLLIPSRTDTKWFHKYIYHNKNAEIIFLQGRLRFVNRTFPSWRADGNFKISPAPFPSMLVIFKNIQKGAEQ